MAPDDRTGVPGIPRAPGDGVMVPRTKVMACGARTGPPRDRAEAPENRNRGSWGQGSWG
jgi:hypothetical protein